MGVGMQEWQWGCCGLSPKVHEAPEIADMEWDLQNLFHYDLGVDGAWELK